MLKKLFFFRKVLPHGLSKEAQLSFSWKKVAQRNRLD
jgi:hypothetical protein